MLHFIARRVLLMIPTLFVISALVYFIIDLPPGDCVTSQIEELLARGDPDAHQRAEELRQLYGLNLPLWHRYLDWVAGIFRWDFGLSCQDTVPVADLISERMMLTIIMETCTIIFIWVVSFVIGVYAATHQYKWGDYVASFIGFIGLSIYVPIYFETIMGLSATQSGLALLPLMTGSTIGAVICGKLMATMPRYKIAPMIGLLLGGLCLLPLFFQPEGMSLLTVEILFTVVSIGVGGVFPVTTISIQNAVPRHDLGTATALITFMRNLGAATGVAVFGTLVIGGGLGESAGAAVAGSTPGWRRTRATSVARLTEA